MLLCNGGDRGTKWQSVTEKIPSSLGYYGDWARAHDLPWGGILGNEGILSLSRLAKEPHRFVNFQGAIWLHNKFFLYFLCLKTIGFVFQVCLLTRIRDGSLGPTRQLSISRHTHEMGTMGTISNPV